MEKQYLALQELIGISLYMIYFFNVLNIWKYMRVCDCSWFFKKLHWKVVKFVFICDFFNEPFYSFNIVMRGIVVKPD